MVGNMRSGLNPGETSTLDIWHEEFPECEHSFCEQCIKHWLSRRPVCPIDRENVTLAQLKPVPRVLRNLLSRLPVKCPYSDQGCTAKLTLEQLNSHQNVCPCNPASRRSLIELYEDISEMVVLRQNKNIILSRNEGRDSLLTLDHNFLEDKEIASDFLSNLISEISFKEYTAYNLRGAPHQLPRMVAYYGPCDHDSGGIHLEADEDWPPILECIRDCVQEYLRPDASREFNSVFMNLFRYEDDSIGWHNYNEVLADDLVAIVSLGDSRTLELKMRADRYRNARFVTTLQNGSLFVMHGATVHNWLYRIPKDYTSSKSKTMMLIFRLLR